MAGLGAEIRYCIKYLVGRPFHINIIARIRLLSVGWLIVWLVFCCVYFIGHTPLGLFRTNGNKQWVINIEINTTRLRIPNSGRQTNWLFTSAIASGQNEIPTRPRCLHQVDWYFSLCLSVCLSVCLSINWLINNCYVSLSSMIKTLINR